MTEIVNDAAVIRIVGRQMYIFCPFPEVMQTLCDELTSRVSVRGVHGFKQELVEAYSLTMRKEGFELLTYSGLSGIVKTVFDTGGFKYVAMERVLKADGTWVEYRLDNLMQLPMLQLPHLSDIADSLREWQTEAFRLFSNLRCGTIRVSTGGGKSYLVVKFCQVASTSRVCVTSSELTDINALYEDLIRAGVETTLVKGKLRDHQRNVRVICVSTASAHHVQSIPFDILFGDEVQKMASRSLRNALWRVYSRRSFGLSATAGQRADRNDIMVTGQFGPIVLERKYSENVAAGDVVPLFYRFINTTCAKKIKSSNAAVRYRNYIVQNDQRNNEIAAMARHYLAKGHQVLIMTLSVEHTLRLWAKLPEAIGAYRSLAANIKQRLVKDKVWCEYFPEKFNDKAMSEAISMFAAGQKMLGIANRVWWKGKNFPMLTVLIRADGQNTDEACVQISGRLSRKCPEIGKTHGLLIDCTDNFDKTCELNANKRKGKYKKMGWKEWQNETIELF